MTLPLRVDRRERAATEIEKILGRATPDIELRVPATFREAWAMLVELPLILTLGSAEMEMLTLMPLAFTSVVWVKVLRVLAVALESHEQELVYVLQEWACALYFTSDSVAELSLTNA